MQTVEAIVDEEGQIRLLQPVQGSGRHRAIVTILDDKPEIEPETKVASDEAEKWEQRRKAVASVRAFQEKMRQKYGVQPDSTPLIREMRDHPRK